MLPSRTVALGMLAGTLATIYGCDERAPSPTASSGRAPPSAQPSAVHGAAPPASASASASAATPAPAPTSSSAPRGCPADMVRVQGRYCPRVKHRCLQHSDEYESEQRRRERKRRRGEDPGPRKAVEICLKYDEGECLSKQRRTMRFCIDTFEWPGKEGDDPLLLVTWKQAKALCEGVGKRLCTGAEFNFACEGEDLLPYSYGHERDPERCNIDKPYVTPEKPLPPHDHCFERKWCTDALAKLDQREPIGSHPRCTSPFGAFDLNGNVNEWVERPGKRSPWRSGLKGGWWGPARSRCRPMVIAHDEDYSGYEVGFRCCRDVEG